MKIAVTGASGFIGRHVLACLVARSVDTIAITRNRSRLSDWQSQVQVLVLDIGSFGADIYERLGRPDALIHLAWEGLPNYKSLHHFEAELPKQYGFLKAAVEGGLPVLVAAGTCFEYGMQTGALSEAMPTFPTNPYGYAKDALRRQLEFLRSTHPFEFTWGRLFYLFGDGQSTNALYSQLKTAVSRGDRVFNMSGGEQLRDYLPVTEVASLVVGLALAGRDSGIVNICAGQPTSVRRLVETWISENGWNIVLNLGHYPYADYEPMAFWGDRRRLDSILGGA